MIELTLTERLAQTDSLLRAALSNLSKEIQQTTSKLKKVDKLNISKTKPKS